MSVRRWEAGGRTIKKRSLYSLVCFGARKRQPILSVHSLPQHMHTSFSVTAFFFFSRDIAIIGFVAKVYGWIHSQSDFLFMQLTSETSSSHFKKYFSFSYAVYISFWPFLPTSKLDQSFPYHMVKNLNQSFPWKAYIYAYLIKITYKVSSTLNCLIKILYVTFQQITKYNCRSDNKIEIFFFIKSEQQ